MPTKDIGMLSKLIEEFESRNIAVCVIGTDTGSLTYC
jgi:hypothetical protein